MKMRSNVTEALRQIYPKAFARQVQAPAMSGLSVQPRHEHWLVAALGALLAPRAASTFLSLPAQWAMQEAARLAQEEERAWRRALESAKLEIERERAYAPIRVAQIETEPRARQLQLQERKYVELEKPRFGS